jgi:hypothetical protein
MVRANFFLYPQAQGRGNGWWILFVGTKNVFAVSCRLRPGHSLIYTHRDTLADNHTNSLSSSRALSLLHARVCVCVCARARVRVHNCSGALKDSEGALESE